MLLMGSFVFLFIIKKICLTILILLPFFLFSLLDIIYKISAYETYGSFWVDFLHDKRGKLIKADHLFFNVFDYWALIHAGEIVKCEGWYHPKIAKLERYIRKK